MKTVELGARGQFVIPKEFREDLGLKAASTLVIIEKNGELTIKKPDAFIEKFEAERASAWSEKALKRVWDNPEDDVWAKYL